MISNQPPTPIPPEEGVEDFAQILLAIKSTAAISNDNQNQEQMFPPELVVSSLKDNQTFIKEHDPDYSEGDSTQAETLGSEDEDYEAMENDSDEEWFEPNLDKLSGSERKTDGDHISSSAPSHRLKRKKAPSGSACEKHKRWKKRCPDDCPMRKARFRHGSKTGEKKTLRRTHKTPAASTIKKEEDSRPNLRSRPHVESCEESLASEEGRDMPSGLTQRGVEPPQSLPSPKEEDRAPREDQRDSMQDPDSMEACNKHTHLGIPCPPTCPKKPHKAWATPAHPAPASPPAPSELAAASPASAAPEEREDKGVNTRRQASKRSPPQLEGSQRTKRLKYLPRSCERHKLLHAKCGADCPDRIQRDEEERKIVEKHPEKMHWRKKLVHLPFVQSAT